MNEFTREQRGRKEDVCSGAHMPIWKGKRTPPSSLSESSWDNKCIVSIDGIGTCGAYNELIVCDQGYIKIALIFVSSG